MMMVRWKVLDTMLSLNSKLDADKSRRPVEFKLGDQVLSTQHIRLDSEAERPWRKLRPVFCGPYGISERVGRAAYPLLEVPTQVIGSNLVEKILTGLNRVGKNGDPVRPGSAKVSAFSGVWPGLT
jgi:hypothetical protein